MRHYSQDRDVLKNLPEGGDGWSTNATLWKCSTLFQVVMHPRSHLCVEKDCQPNVDALRIESQSEVPPPPVTDASFLWLFFFYISAESETETPRKRRGAVWNLKKRNGSKQKGPGRKEKKGQTRIKQTNPGRDRVQKSKYTNRRGMNTQNTKERGKHIDSISLCCSRIILCDWVHIQSNLLRLQDSHPGDCGSSPPLGVSDEGPQPLKQHKLMFIRLYNAE